MAVPIVENIAVNIEAAVNAITGAGFQQTLKAVRPTRFDFGDIVPENGTVLIIQDDPRPADPEAAQTDEWMQPFNLQAFVLDSKDTTTSIDIRLNQVRSDIEKKLMEDNTRGVNDGNKNAIDTKLRGAAIFNHGQGHTGITVFVDIHYRVKSDDPYTKG